jgi:hypothetical protein
MNFIQQSFQIARDQSGFKTHSRKPLRCLFETAVNRRQLAKPSPHVEANTSVRQRKLQGQENILIAQKRQAGFPEYEAPERGP